MKKYRIILLLVVFVVLILVAAEFSSPAPAAEPSSALAVLPPVTTAQEPEPSAAQDTEPTVPETTQAPDYILTLLDEMSLQQKVGQLFIINPELLNLTGEAGSPITGGYTEVTSVMKDALRKYPVGGIIMFGKNILSADQITKFNASLQSAVDIPLFICVDEEGGLVARLANHNAFELPKYQSAAAVGTSGDSTQALEMGCTIGAYLKEYGFNTNFAPVADVNTNPKNSIIGSRAFSSDPVIAAQMASAMADGLRENGIIPTFKHFPGHGDTAEDSHHGLAVSYKTEEELASCEWLPFEAAGSSDLVMVGHIALPNVTGNNTPATMSHEIITGILKEKLGFQGLVVTDSLGMGAIEKQYDHAQATLGALQAGCDLLLVSSDFTQSFDAVVEAVENGSFSGDQLDAIVERILRFKAQHGLLGVG